jgi:hypothetical protein
MPLLGDGRLLAFSVMDADGLRSACWRCYAAPYDDLDELEADLRRRVSEDPEVALGLLCGWISDSARPDDAALYESGLRSLVELGEDWATRVARLAAANERISHALACAFLDDQPRLVRLVGRPHLVETWIRFQSADSAWDFWAADLVMGAVDLLDVDEAWALILDLAAGAACDDEVLAMVGVAAVEDLLHRDWKAAIERIERDAPQNEPIRRALWSVGNLIGVPATVIERVHRAADQPPSGRTDGD